MRITLALILAALVLGLWSALFPPSLDGRFFVALILLIIAGVRIWRSVPKETRS